MLELKFDNLTDYASHLRLERRTVASLCERGLIQPAAKVVSSGELLFNRRNLEHDLEVTEVIRRKRN